MEFETVILIYASLLGLSILMTLTVVALVASIRESIQRKRAAKTPLIGVVLPRDMKE